MKLRTILGQLVAVTLANGCAPSHTGGGCPPHYVTQKVGADADAKLKELVAACVGTPETCKPVCKEMFDRQNENGAGFENCRVEKHGDVADVSYVWSHFCSGRRPCAMTSEPVATTRDWLREQGRLEAASVIAFDQLADDLVAHRAPDRLVEACRRAARDEARHARACGATPATWPTGARRTPSLEAMAIDNAIEGEVRETWGAVSAAWQAKTAGSPSIRALMAAIAPDELRHAELSAELARFYASRLSPAARARVTAAKASAVAELVASIATEMPAQLAIDVGVPSARANAQLVAGLRATVWA